MIPAPSLQSLVKSNGTLGLLGQDWEKKAAFIIEQGAIMKTKQIFKVYHILLTRIVAFHTKSNAI